MYLFWGSPQKKSSNFMRTTISLSMSIYILCLSSFTFETAASNKILDDIKHNNRLLRVSSKRNSFDKESKLNLKEYFHKNASLQTIQSVKNYKEYKGTEFNSEGHKKLRISKRRNGKLNYLKKKENLNDILIHFFNSRGGDISSSTPSASSNSVRKYRIDSIDDTNMIYSLLSFYRNFVKTEIFNTLKTLFFISLWYALNIHYNLVNKRVLNHIPLPYTVATLQLFIGSIYVTLLWIFRIRGFPSIFKNVASGHNNASVKSKNCESSNVTSGSSKNRNFPSFSSISFEPQVLQAIYPVGIFHGLGQICTVLSLGAGAVSFTHIVKAMEPFFSALVAMVFFHQLFSLKVYLTLIPVVFGVSLACYSDLSFNWTSFLTAMTSNAMFALRANYSKLALNELKIMQRKLSKVIQSEKTRMVKSKTIEDIKTKEVKDLNFTAQNIYALVTIASLFVAIPITLIMEGSIIKRQAKASIESSTLTSQQLLISLISSGLSHYLNNEVMYLALDNIHPISLAVANTFKRVVIILTSLIVYNTKLTPLGSFGSLVGVTGVFLYSLAMK